MERHNAEARLQELALELPPPPPPGGIYQPVLVVDRLLYVSGQVPRLADGTFLTGRVGEDLDMEAGKRAARQVGLNMLATIKAHFGPLDGVRRLVKTLGMVNSAPSFEQHPQVINGFSELMRDLWGPQDGIGARSAVGMFLPLNVAVEIEAIFELYD